MTTTRTCPKCRAEIVGRALGGLCPKCVAAVAFGVEADAQDSPATSVPLTEKPGDRIGEYKLVEEIGEGGCGVVYLAEQEEPVRRQVALKVIKLGMDTRQVIARFEAERQALALMNHSNIAKVFDAGATETGRPYFVMELVQGAPITRYCDEHCLRTEQRLRLFVQVCQAVQHAHQKGIIHRDLKPTNILVADQDGVPVPKIIDFGIAKATTDQRLTDKTLFTAFEQFLGTPAYMSPEQARLSPESSTDIDTRCDIYSLGVLLYELLTDRTPFDAKRLLASGLDEVRRVIREEEPVRPSTRLLSLNADEQTAVARNRQADRPKLILQVRGDLDWVVMKALEKDRVRRYETANGLASDVQHYLADEPVLARPPGKFYRFRKLVRRNKLLFTALSAVGAAVFMGLALSTWLLVKERAARRTAVAAEQRAEQVARLLKKMLQGVGPSKALGRDTTMLWEILEETARNLSQDLTNQPEVEIELRLTLARTYQDLGLYRQMEAMARRSLELARVKLGPNNPAVADALSSLGDALWGQLRQEEAETMQREALAVRRRLLGNEHPDVATSLDRLADLLAEQPGKWSEEEALRREALTIRRKLLGYKDPETAASLARLAHVLRQRGRVAEVEAVSGEAKSVGEKLVGSQQPEAARSMFYLAQAQLDQVGTDQGNLAEAEVRLGEVLALQRKLLGQHPDVVASLRQLGFVLLAECKLSEAEAAFREAVAIRRKLLGNSHPLTASMLWNLALVLEEEGKWAGIEAIYRDFLAIQTNLLSGDSPFVTQQAGGLMYMLMNGRLHGRAELALNEVLSPTFQQNPQSAPLLRSRAELFARGRRWHEASADLRRMLRFAIKEPEPYLMLAATLVAGGDLQSYQELRRNGVELFALTSDPTVAHDIAMAYLILPSSEAGLETAAIMAQSALDHNSPGRPWFLPGTNCLRFVRGLAEYRQGHFAEAVALMQNVLADSGEDFFRCAEAWAVLAMAWQQTNQGDEAREALAKSVEIVDGKLQGLDCAGLSLGGRGLYWVDWIIAHALLDEAKGLIEGGSISSETN